MLSPLARYIRLPRSITDDRSGCSHCKYGPDIMTGVPLVPAVTLRQNSEVSLLLKLHKLSSTVSPHQVRRILRPPQGYIYYCRLEEGRGSRRGQQQATLHSTSDIRADGLSF